MSSAGMNCIINQNWEVETGIKSAQHRLLVIL